MDLLAGYNSSPSSSSSSSVPLSSPLHSTINYNETVLLSRDSRHAINVDIAHHSSGVGSDGDCSSGATCHDGRGNSPTTGRNNRKHNSTSTSTSDRKRLVANGKRIRDTTSSDMREEEEEDDGGEKVTEGNNNFPNHRERNERKRKLIQPSSTEKTTVIIAGCEVDSSQTGSRSDANNNQQPKFERNQPHWEGRWVGHLALPFPPLRSLDLVYSEEEEDVKKRRRTSDNDEHGRDDIERGSSSSSEESSDSSSDDDDEEDAVSQSRHFLPEARKLIHHWAALLEKTTHATINEKKNNKTIMDTTITTSQSKNEDHTSREAATIVIIPHIPMHPIKAAANAPPSSNKESSSPSSLSPLHVSLARPIYLPAPSVNPLMAEIETRIKAVLSIANNRKKSTNSYTNNCSNGRTLQLQPQNATIFTNDQQTRSFLAIPVSAESARWIKRMLLPPIDNAMVRFGLQTYYSTEEDGGEEGGGCILHVSVASVKGNVIPSILRQRHRKRCQQGMMTVKGNEDDDVENVKSIPLFSKHEIKQKEGDTVLESSSLPRCIPIRVNQIQCRFGKAKGLTIPF
mmetsp:Transcript_8836/g.19072  ORF Transcript_8836/g.19072 Transcript_8836/m.19072 type:complete len:570 (+) Transcript_8836:65-1774(+)